MMVTSAVVICAVGLYAREFSQPRGMPEAAPVGVLDPAAGDLERAEHRRWTMISSIYVALELLTFAAVPLVCRRAAGNDQGSAALFAVCPVWVGVYLLGVAFLAHMAHARHPPSIDPGASRTHRLITAVMMTMGRWRRPRCFLFTSGCHLPMPVLPLPAAPYFRRWS
jgi:hypothetical protein